MAKKRKAPKKRKAVKKRKAAKKTTKRKTVLGKKDSVSLHTKLTRLGLRLPHGYELVKKKPVRKKAKKRK